jgi:hypothetical protein
MHNDEIHECILDIMSDDEFHGFPRGGSNEVASWPGYTHTRTHTHTHSHTQNKHTHTQKQTHKSQTCTHALQTHMHAHKPTTSRAETQHTCTGQHACPSRADLSVLRFSFKHTRADLCCVFLNRHVRQKKDMHSCVCVTLKAVASACGYTCT